jgi:hypothetical protein
MPETITNFVVAQDTFDLYVSVSLSQSPFQQQQQQQQPPSSLPLALPVTDVHHGVGGRAPHCQRQKSAAHKCRCPNAALKVCVLAAPQRPVGGPRLGQLDAPALIRLSLKFNHSGGVAEKKVNGREKRPKKNGRNREQFYFSRQRKGSRNVTPNNLCSG